MPLCSGSTTMPYWERLHRLDPGRFGDPGFTLTDDTLVVLERFRILERLEPVRNETSSPFRSASR